MISVMSKVSREKVIRIAFSTFKVKYYLNYNKLLVIIKNRYLKIFLKS